MGFSPAELHEREGPVTLTVLMDLAEEVGTDVAARFVHAFVDLWPTRRQRIHAAIYGHDADAAMDAVLSLRSGSLIAGALPLAAHADMIRATLLTPGFPAWESARHHLVALDEIGNRTVETLSGAVAHWPQRPGNESF